MRRKIRPSEADSETIQFPLVQITQHAQCHNLHIIFELCVLLENNLIKIKKELDLTSSFLSIVNTVRFNSAPMRKRYLSTSNILEMM